MNQFLMRTLAAIAAWGLVVALLTVVVWATAVFTLVVLLNL